MSLSQVRPGSTIVAGLFVCALFTSALAEIPRMISYQGKITDSGGTPVADGTYTMRFRIYDAETGGTLEWDSGNQSIAVSGGVFNVLLGESPQPTLNLPFDVDYWLLVTFDGVDQTPRQRLASAGYSYVASGLVPGTVVEGDLSSSILEVTNTRTGSGYGVRGNCYGSSGRGVYGRANSSTGTTYGVYGHANSTSGRGVYGEADAASGITYGVCGSSSSSDTEAAGVYGSGDNRGVYGRATDATGTAYGGYFESSSSSGRGLYGDAVAYGIEARATGTSGTNYGGYFESASTTGRAVAGTATATTGVAYGGKFHSNSTSGRGCYGWATATEGETYGGAFKSSSEEGIGVWGKNEATEGLTYGGLFIADASSGRAVCGVATASPGVMSYGGLFQTHSECGRGVAGFSSSSTGISFGVFGQCASTSGTAVYAFASAESGNTYGVYGRSLSPDGYGVYYEGGIGGSGAMRSIVRTSQGPTSLDVVTAAGSWVEDFGEAELTAGRARIELDPLFLETVTINDEYPLKVFVQLGGDCLGVYVERGDTWFEVRELQRGSASVPFFYRVIARRKGLEGTRLQVVEAARRDTYLYPDKKGELGVSTVPELAMRSED